MYKNVASNRLMIDMVLKNKAGVDCTKDLAIFIVVYGLKGYFNNVDTNAYDALYGLDNGKIVMQTDID